MKKFSAKRALLLSVLSMVICVSMLIGSTFAWFTDSATANVNTIQSGNLDVDLQVKGAGGEWVSADGTTLNFVKLAGHEDEAILWEPGCTYSLPELRVVNNGNLKLKYKVVVTGIDGDTGLASVIDWTINGIELETEQVLDPEATSEFTISGHMQETAGNEYRNLKLEGISITVYATQAIGEYDSNGNTYDEGADVNTINVTTSNIQDYLDGKYGPIDGMTLVLAEGEYDTLKIGGVTADTKGNIVLTCNHTDGTHYSFMTSEEYKAHIAENVFHYTSTYTRSMNNVTFVADGNVTINGILIESGHLHQLANPFREGYTGYYMNHKLTNFTFSGINFVGNVNINTSSADTVIDGFTFDNCTFTTNGTTSDKGQAIRYYNENNNGQVKNLVVKNCSFANCYQGVYTMKVSGISVTGCTFDTTGHNAIAVQGENANHGAVVITGNTFNKVGDRIIRFNVVGAGTQITIKNNNATESGDTNGEVIKATSLADGITYDIGDNSWGEGKVVVNDELKDR